MLPNQAEKFLEPGRNLNSTIPHVGNDLYTFLYIWLGTLLDVHSLYLILEYLRVLYSLRIYILS